VSAVHDIELTPMRGDGRLTAFDVDVALEGVPRGATIDVVVDECDDFEAEAPWRLARALCGSVVTHHFRPGARRVEPDWMALYDHAASEYLAVEARMLGA
jgi:hypothetical protein